MSFLKIILNDSITNTPKKLCQKVTGHKIYSGDYNSQSGSYTPDEHSNRIYVKGDQRKNLQTMLDLQDKYGGDIYKNDKDELKKYTQILYAQARLIEGLNIENPTELSNLICEVMSK